MYRYWLSYIDNFCTMVSDPLNLFKTEFTHTACNLQPILLLTETNSTTQFNTAQFTVKIGSSFIFYDRSPVIK